MFDRLPRTAVFRLLKRNKNVKIQGKPHDTRDNASQVRGLPTKETFVRLYRRLRKNTPLQYRRTVTYLQRNPFRSFFAALGALLLLIVLGTVITNLTRTPAEEHTVVKTVRTYTISETPKLRLQARIEASGVIQIFAQSPGVVQSIDATEGSHVAAGTPIVYLATSYQGGNIASLQQTLAARQNTNAEETYATQKDLIGKQRTLAQETAQNSAGLRDITKQSQGDVQELLRFAEGSIVEIDATIAALETNNPGGINDGLIAQAVAQRAASLQSAVQLRGQLRNIDYQTDLSKPPAELETLQKDITLEQLDIQDKAIDLARDVSRIQLQLAAVQAQLMIPASPVKGTVERIHVKKGQNVQPGTLIATVTGAQNSIQATVLIPRPLATAVSQVEAHTILIGSTPVRVTPTYVSQSPTDGQLYSILYNLPDTVADDVTDGEYVTAEIPVGTAEEQGSIPYIPIDSVYQTQEEAFVTVLEGDTAASKKITLGDVYGRYVAVLSGLSSGDSIILNRNVIAGEQVRLEE